jgi:hypothetical protein
MMNHRGVRANQQSSARFFCSDTQIGILAIHEKLEVKSPQLTPKIPVDHEQASTDDIHLADGIPIPAPQRLGV